MKVKIHQPPSYLIGQREIEGTKRYYYAHLSYPDLLLVSHDQPLKALHGKIGVALFGHPDSTIVCDVLPDAPPRWRGVRLTQCTIKLVQRLPRGKAVELREALKQNAERYGYGESKDGET
jgi:hypothetical protein